MLPDAAWRGRAGLRRIVAALGADAVKIVGGAVRDTLLGLPVTDIDLATPLLPQEVTRRLEAADIKVIPTGIAHGTVTAIASGDHHEITTLRRDVETDGRRATIAFADDWREDAARRDFTINALYADPLTGAVDDWFGGLADLQAGCVRFIGDAATRIAEDYLRILRFYRFAARFGDGNLEPVSHAAVTAARQSLKSLSRERIADELTKILSLPDPRAIVGQMAADGIFAVILPELDPTFAAALDRLLANESATAAAPASPIRSRADCACRRGSASICRRSARIATTRGRCVSLPMPSGSRRRATRGCSAGMRAMQRLRSRRSTAGPCRSFRCAAATSLHAASRRARRLRASCKASRRNGWRKIIRTPRASPNWSIR